MSLRLASAASIVAWLFIGLFFAVTFVAPLLVVLTKSIGSPFFQNYVSVLGAESTRTIMARTLRLGAIVTLACMLLGYPAAYAMTKLNSLWRSVVFAVIVLPFLTSYLVRTYGWIAILGNNGLMATIGKWFGAEGTSLNGTMTGLVIAMTHMLLPLMILPLYAAMSSIDGRQVLAAGSMGAGPAETFLRVYFPQTVTGLLSGALLVFVVSLGFFITPALIGGLRETTIAQIIYSYINEMFDWGRSASLAVSLLLIVLLALVVTGRFVSLTAVFGIKDNGSNRKSGRRTAQTGKIFMGLYRLASTLPGQRHAGVVCFAFLVVSLAVLVIPLVYVLFVSFQPLRLLALPTAGFSTVWYHTVLTKQEWFEAAVNSLFIAVLSTSIALPIGFFLASKARSRGPAMNLAITLVAIGPLALPHILLALGLYGVYVQLGWLGNILTLALAHAVCALPYVFVNIANGLAAYDVRLDQAASSMGAPPWSALWRIKLPVLRPSIVTAAAFAFLTSFDELICTLFLAGATIPTLPVRMWAATSQNISPELAVVGTLLIAMVIVVFTVLKVVQSGRRTIALPATSRIPELVHP